MYRYASTGLPVTKRVRRNELQYVRINDSKELENFGDISYVYCLKSQILITCEFGGHWEAMQEHLCDFLEANGWFVFPDGEPDIFLAGDISHLSADIINQCERFLADDLVLSSPYVVDSHNTAAYFSQALEGRRNVKKDSPVT